MTIWCSSAGADAARTHTHAGRVAGIQFHILNRRGKEGKRIGKLILINKLIKLLNNVTKYKIT